MSNQNRPQFKAREKTFLSDYNLNVPGPVQNGATFPSEFRLAWVASSNSVAIQIETKVRDAKNYGRYEIVAPYMSVIGIMECVKMLANDEAKKIAYRIKDYVFFGGQRSDSPKVKATMTVGRDQDGVIFFGLSGKDIQPIKFTMALSKYDEVTIDEVDSAAATSLLAAKVMYTTFTGLLPVISAIHYKEPEKREPKSGNGGNGGGNSYGSNRNNNGGGNSGGNGGGFDQDLPF